MQLIFVILVIFLIFCGLVLVVDSDARRRLKSYDWLDFLFHAQGWDGEGGPGIIFLLLITPIAMVCYLIRLVKKLFCVIWNFLFYYPVWSDKKKPGLIIKLFGIKTEEDEKTD